MTRAFTLFGLTFLVGCFASRGLNEDGTCAAVPICEADTIEVERCVGDTPCYEETLCGVTIFCADDICEPSDPCYENESEVPICDEVSPDCRARISCGGPVYCQRNLCRATPSCEAGERVVSSCEGEDISCRSVSVCGSTIYCSWECDGDPEPFCEEEQVQMSVGEACPSDWRCRVMEGCRTVIQCGYFMGDDD